MVLMPRFGGPAVAVLSLCAALTRPTELHAARVIGQWDFNTNSLAATQGLALEYYGSTTASRTAFGTTTSFGIPAIGGTVASVMRFPACGPAEGYILHTNAPGNAGGAYINQYSLVLDLLYPGSSTNAWRAIFQTARGNDNDAEFFVGTNTSSPNPNGIGISGQYHGTIQANTWHRVAVTVDLATQTMAKYIDGTLVGTQSLSDSLNGRWSLYSTDTAPDWVLLFTDENNETKPGYVNSIQFRDYAMSAFEIAQLGGASASGIPLPTAPSSLQVLAPNGGEQWQAGTTQIISWVANAPSGAVNIDLYDNGVLWARLGQAPAAAGQFSWSISPSLGDSTHYRVRISAAAFPEITDTSDADFSVEGSVPTPTVITKLPMLQDYRTDAMNLIWETTTRGNPGAVEFGMTDVAENTITDVFTQQLDATHFIHTATMQPLQAESVYKYRVRSGTTTSPTFTFRTAPRPGTPVRTVWFADEQGHTIFRQQVPYIAARDPDLVLASGDLMPSGADITHWHDYWFNPLEISNLAQTTPVLFSRGNHDGEGALAYAYSVLPGNEAWFAFTYGNVRFIFLDTNRQTADQTAWLQAELASMDAQRAPFRIVSFHMPPYTDLWDSPGYIGESFVRDNWVPLFEQYKVDVVINGHTHAYLRGLHNGVLYLIVGGAGNALDTYVSYNWGFFDVKQSVHHYGVMDTNRNTLVWNAYDVSDVLFDSYALASRTPLSAADFDADTDVDEDDFTRFVACVSGPAVPRTPECALQDLDADQDVDQSDFGLFQRCVSGAGQLPIADCAH